MTDLLYESASLGNPSFGSTGNLPVPIPNIARDLLFCAAAVQPSTNIIFRKRAIIILPLECGGSIEDSGQQPERRYLFWPFLAVVSADF
jgi:hypothetical protein